MVWEESVQEKGGALGRVRLSLSIGVVCSAILAVVVAAAPASAAAQPAPPQPIPGGIQIPGGPLIHTFAPGPKSIGGQGVYVDPSTITDFRGFSALAYMVGTAHDADGNTYTMSTDMRVFSGNYVGADGVTYTGTFVFI
jgi:hypothetical protein